MKKLLLSSAIIGFAACSGTPAETDSEVNMEESLHPNTELASCTTTIDKDTNHTVSFKFTHAHILTITEESDHEPYDPIVYQLTVRTTPPPLTPEMARFSCSDDNDKIQVWGDFAMIDDVIYNFARKAIQPLPPENTELIYRCENSPEADDEGNVPTVHPSIVRLTETADGIKLEGNLLNSKLDYLDVDYAWAADTQEKKELRQQIMGAIVPNVAIDLSEQTIIVLNYEDLSFMISGQDRFVCNAIDDSPRG